MLFLMQKKPNGLGSIHFWDFYVFTLVTLGPFQGMKEGSHKVGAMERIDQEVKHKVHVKFQANWTESDFP